MADVLTVLTNASLGNVLVLSGVAFLALALLGRWKNWFALSRTTRYTSAGLGVALVIAGGAVDGGVIGRRLDTIDDIAIIVDAANTTQPTTTGRFHIDGKYMGSITQTQNGGGRLNIGPLSRGEHRFTMDLEFTPPFNGSNNFSCSGTFSVSGPSLLVPRAMPNSTGSLTDCVLVNVR